MTDDLRAQVRLLLRERGLSQADRHAVSRALAHNGAVPPIWQKMLDALGLELSVRPKSAA